MNSAHNSTPPPVSCTVLSTHVLILLVATFLMYAGMSGFGIKGVKLPLLGRFQPEIRQISVFFRLDFSRFWLTEPICNEIRSKKVTDLSNFRLKPEIPVCMFILLANGRLKMFALLQSNHHHSAQCGQLRNNCSLGWKSKYIPEDISVLIIFPCLSQRC